jgi:hypothetical protein
MDQTISPEFYTKLSRYKSILDKYRTVISNIGEEITSDNSILI